MKKAILTLVCLLTLSTAAVFAQGIEFEQGTWEEVLAKAKKENKPIFVDAYAAWCGPCKYMAYNIFPDEKVGEFYNKNFINYKYDMEKGDGPKFASQYKVNAYPTFLFIDKDGAVQYRTMGGKQADAFIQVGEDALAYFKKK